MTSRTVFKTRSVRMPFVVMATVRNRGKWPGWFWQIQRSSSGRSSRAERLPASDVHFPQSFELRRREQRGPNRKFEIGDLFGDAPDVAHAAAADATVGDFEADRLQCSGFSRQPQILITATIGEQSCRNMHHPAPGPDFSPWAARNSSGLMTRTLVDLPSGSICSFHDGLPLVRKPLLGENPQEKRRAAHISDRPAWHSSEIQRPAHCLTKPAVRTPVRSIPTA